MPFGLFDSANPGPTGDLGMGLNIAGSVMSVIGAFAGAQAERSRLQFQADMDRVNQAIAETNARAALMVGQREAQAVMLRTGQIKASQEASMAANGIDIGEGTAARVRTSTEFMGQTDVNTVAANAIRAAFGYRMQGTNFGIDATMRSAAADSVSPWMSAGTSLLTGAGRVAPQWYALKRG